MRIYPQKTITIQGVKTVIHFKCKYDNEDVHLNPKLIREKHISSARVKKILHIYKQLDKLFIKMRDNPKCDLRKSSNRFHNLQYRLQDAWKFPKDICYHKFWLLPKCECPKMDNDDAYPTGRYVMNSACPIHGDVPCE